MSRSSRTSGPQFRADRPGEQEAVRTTIVGGRPPGSGKPLGPIPRGIDVLVKKAAVDPAFRALLLSDRARAADEIGLALDPAEAAMLAAVPSAQLTTIIERTTVPVEQRRAFLGKVAAAMLAVLGAGGELAAAGGLAVSGGAAGGIMPDRPMPAPTGSRPDRPPVVEGIRPDPPPSSPRPETLRRVIAVVARQLGVPDHRLSPTTRFDADLKMGAAKREALRGALEREFSVALSPRGFGELPDVASVAKHVEAVSAVSNRVLDTVAGQLAVARATLTGKTSLEGDLNVTRLELAQLRRRLASGFRVYLDWDEFKELKTVGDVVDVVARQVAKRQEAAGAGQQPKPPSPVSRGSRPDLPPMSFGIRPDEPRPIGGIRPY